MFYTVAIKPLTWPNTAIITSDPMSFTDAIQWAQQNNHDAELVLMFGQNHMGEIMEKYCYNNGAWKAY